MVDAGKIGVPTDATSGLVVPSSATPTSDDRSGTLATASSSNLSTPPRPAKTKSLRASYLNAARGTWVSVYDGEASGLDTDGGRWQVVCERHGEILSVETLDQAKDDARYDPAEFCEECRNEQEEETYGD